MRYSLLTGALAAGIYASPLVVRDYVTKYAYVTAVVTVTAGEQPAPTQEASVAAVPTSNWWDQYKWHKAHSHTKAPAPAAPAPTSAEAPKPKPHTTKKATSAAPKPKPTTAAPAPKPEPTTSEVEAAATEAPEPSKASSGGKPAFSDIVVIHHNIHRANHSAGKVKWDQGLADTASRIAQSCNYAHNVDQDGGGYGQNIAAGAPSDNISSIITDHFYNDEMGFFEPFYNQDTPSDMSDATFDKFGHFTQIVWKGTQKVGCAVQDCRGHGNGPNGLGLVADNVPPYFTVCNYSPPGNYLGDFKDNVAKPKGKANVNWSYGL